MEAILRDLRFGMKLLARERAFSLAVLVTLGVCIGANVVIFSVVQAVVFRPLQFNEADRLVTMYNSYPGAGTPRRPNSAPDYFLRREQVQAFEEVAAYQVSNHAIGESGSTERVETMRVTALFFRLLGVQPIIGREFLEGEMEPASAQKVVLAYDFWQERFGGESDVVGQHLRVDGHSYAVVAVLPSDFQFVGRPNARFFVPIQFTAEQRSLRLWHTNNYQMLARLRPGATAEQAEAQIGAMNASLLDEWAPDGRQLLEDAQFRTVVVGMQDDLVREIRPTLLLLWAGVGFVLLIGCVNVANLMLARSQVRIRELTTRMALGARRVRLARQILTESVLIGLLGGLIGIGLAGQALRLLSLLHIEELPRGTEVGLDAPVLLYTAALVLGASVVFGMIPIVHLFRSDMGNTFREADRSGTESRAAVLSRGALVTAQVALAFLLLVGAGLMFRTFLAASAVDPGFRSENVLTASVVLPSSRYPDASSRRRFADEFVARVRALPGVQAAGVTNQLPFGGDSADTGIIRPENLELSPGESILSPFDIRVGPGYFETLRIRLVEGRTFLESDGPEQPNVIIIDQALARRYWPNQSPLGLRMTRALPGVEVDEEALYTVIGVVETVKQNDLTASEHVGAYYRTYRQLPVGSLTFAILTQPEVTGIISSARNALARLDPELPLFGAQPMEKRLAASLLSRRTAMVVLLASAGIALFLAVVGIYGTLAYTVTQRTREIGIRMALGSRPSGILGLVLRQGLSLAGVGLIAGTVAAFPLVRLVQSLLFGVQPTDPLVLAGTSAILVIAAAAACMVPARRATRIDPATTLRQG